MASFGSATGGRLLRYLLRAAALFGLVVLVTAAVYVGAGRYLVTQVGVYKTDLESLLSERLGRRVEIDSLLGDWVGFDPVVVVDGLAVGDPDQPEASLQRLRIRLATGSSIARGRLVFSEFSAFHADLTLTQDTKGSIGLAGLWTPAADEAKGLELLEAAAEDFDNSFSDWVEELGRVLADPVVHVSDLRIRVQSPDEPDQHYQIPSIDLSFQQGVFSAAGRLIGMETTETVAWFTLEGQHFFRGGFDGTVYLDLRSERLFDAFLRRYEWFEVGLEGLDLKTSTWLTFEDGQIARVLARLNTPYLQLRGPSETLSPIEDLDVTLAASRLDAPCAEPNPCRPTWKLQAEDLRYRWLGETVGPMDVSWTRADEKWRLAVDTVPVDNVLRLVRALELLPEAAAQYLHAYRPRGELQQLVFDYVNPQDYHLTTGLRQAAVDGVGGSPVVEGLDGWLEHRPRGGRVVYDSRDTVFGFPQLFTGAWEFQRLSGEVAWEAGSSGWRVFGDDLRFRYQRGTLLTGGFELVLSPARRNHLALQVGIAGADYQHIAQFVPVGAVGEPLYNWLSTAFRGGQIPWGWYYGAGPIQAPLEAEDAEDPAEQRKAGFTSAMVFDFHEVAFAYSEDWPILDHSAGQFRYQDGNGWVDIDRARAGGVALEPSRVLIDTQGPETRVDVAVSAPVSGEDLTFWLKNSPLGELAGDPGEAVQVEGEAGLGLNLSLYPGTSSETSTGVDLALDAKGLRIAHPASALQWSDLVGIVRYSSETGLSAQGLRGRFLDHEVRFELSGGTEETAVQLHQWGRARVDELIDRWVGRPLSVIEGTFDYDLRADFGGDTADTPARPVIGFRAALGDVAIALPPPFSKPAGQGGSLHGNLVVESSERYRLQGTLKTGPDQQLGYQALSTGGQLAGASVHFGSEASALVKGVFQVGGSVGQLDVGQWLDAWESLDASHDETSASDATVALDLPVRVSLTAAQLVLGGIDFGRVELSAADAEEAWEVEAQGERLAGTAMFSENGPYQIDLARLKLPSPATGDDAATGLKPEPAQQYPDADVAVQEFWLGEKNYGRWRFGLRSTPDSLSLNNLEAQTGSLIFSGDLVWEKSSGAPGRTRLTGDLKGENIGDLNAWVSGGVPLVSETTNAHLDLNWPGGPRNFGLGNARGELALSLEDGRILDQNNAAQIFRVFGVLNADTLMRRLRLDFSDLYKPGVTFEALSGAAVVKDGVLTLDPELQLAGPSGAFKLTGQTHLLAEQLDMRLVVVLPLTQNLPVAALLFGAAAPVGGALFILDKLLGDPLSKLTSATYEVSGSWQNPQIKLRNIFDTGADVREYERPDLQN